MISKTKIKRLLGEIPYTAEAYWRLRQQGKPLSRSFSLRRVQRSLPDWRSAALHARTSSEPGQRVLIFTTLIYWLEYCTLLGTTLSGLGHDVTLGYLPYPNWRKPLNRFDLRRHNMYARQVLRGAEPALHPLSFLNVRRSPDLPTPLRKAVQEVALRDTQYTLQVEDVERTGNSASAQLYRLRLERNLHTARAALAWLLENKPDVVITPNGSILEMGALYQTARYLGIPVVTFEFGEQRGRIWMAHNREVMHQETGDLWAARKDTPLAPEQLEQVRALFASRQNASLWENFARRWQGQASQGGEQVRQNLGLDERPVVLLAANVIGDSLTLGRQVFTDSMTEWLERTLHLFAGMPQAQLVVRIHPGERYTKGPSVSEVVERTLPELPENIHLVKADDPINTYDIVEIADLGLVYTTTVGMEMAMSGVPVVVVGQTHYRDKGFTLDPASWKEYEQRLQSALADPLAARLTQEQVDQAWNYAYRFFFEFPQPFPWHLLDYWEQIETWPVRRVLSAEGQAEFGATLRHLLGEPFHWAASQPDPHKEQPA